MWLTTKAKSMFSATLLVLPILFTGCAPAQTPVTPAGSGTNAVQSEAPSTEPVGTETGSTSKPSEKTMAESDKDNSMKTATFGAESSCD